MHQEVKLRKIKRNAIVNNLNIIIITALTHSKNSPTDTLLLEIPRAANTKILILVTIGNSMVTYVNDLK